MSKMLELYEIVKTCIPASITPKFSYVETVKPGTKDKYEVIENTAGIYFRPNMANKRDIAGNYLQESYRLLINLYTTRGETGIKNGIVICEEIVSKLDKIYNKSYSINGVGVYIANAERSQSFGYVGPTDQGVATFSINYLITFS